jgi:two-component system, chemotaxis family, chemotaxis protein CheY
MKTILVVEDFSSIRRFLCSKLQSKGYKTIAASTGEEAYELLTNKSSKVNLVLSDFNMPDCSGFDLLKTIKRNPALEDIPVVFLTTEALSDKIRIAQETGIAGFIHKPYREDAFFAEIKRAIRIAGSIVNIVD